MSSISQENIFAIAIIHNEKAICTLSSVEWEKIKVKRFPGEEMSERDKGDQEYTYHDKHWVVYRIGGSLYYTSETNIYCMLTTLENF